MKHIILTGDKQYDDKLLNEAATLLKNGQVVAFPTETVYGLGANARDEKAISKIFEAKGRPADNPLIVHVASVEQLRGLTTNLPQYVEKLMTHFSPGPITYVLEHNGSCAHNVTAGLNTIAIRIPDHLVALALIEKSNLPIAAPSANLSGKPSPTLASHVIEDLKGKISAVVDGGETGVGVESTVIDCTGEKPIILRHGGVTMEQLIKVVDVIDLQEIEEQCVDKPKSPGMKYKHYAPDIPLILVDGNVEKVKKVIRNKKEQNYKIGLLAKEDVINAVIADVKISLGTDDQDVAKNLYRALRLLSKESIDFIVCESVTKKGVGKAIMDRLERAATVIV